MCMRHRWVLRWMRSRWMRGAKPMSNLDIVPRGPRRWHRLATSHVEHPTWEQSKLYAERLTAARRWLQQEELPGWAAFRHIEPAYWTNDKEKAFYTCSPLCAAMARQTRSAPIEAVTVIPKRARCEVCGKTQETGPLFNVAEPTQEDAANYREWFIERTAWKEAKNAEWRDQSNLRRSLREAAETRALEPSEIELFTQVGQTPPLQPLLGVVTPQQNTERIVTVLVDAGGYEVVGVRKLRFTEAEVLLWSQITNMRWRQDYARANGEVV